MKQIDEYHESKAQEPRVHLGASMLGHPCDRWLWLSFRWAVIEKFPGRVLRLFRRGNLEERVIIEDLTAIGVQIRHTGVTSMRVNFDHHIGGTLDGVIEYGWPGKGKTRMVAEFKTHSKKSFDDLEKKGVEVSKPMHYTQMQLYMLGTKIHEAMYIAVCKDDDRIYTENVSFDQAFAEKALERGKRITSSDEMPPPISTDPSWYQCKFCPAHEFCHVTKLTQEVNCRTCALSTAKPDSTWLCEECNQTIPEHVQRKGCNKHVLHPHLVPWKMKPSTMKNIAVYEIDGRDVANGEPDANIYASREIVACHEVCGIDDKFIKDIRAMGGEISGRV